MAKRGADKGVTIIKREEVVEGGHHGGAWKVAYADFVTAMMAFFLLMWLLNATTEKQRRGLADYFSPTTIQARGASGSGQPLGGKSPFEDSPEVSDRGTVSVMNANAPPVEQEDDGSDTMAVRTVHAEGQAAAKDGAGAERAGADKAAQQSRPGVASAGRIKTVNDGRDPASLAAEAARQAEQLKLVDAARQMQRAIAADPALTALARQLSIDLTPDGLRIQIHDEDGEPMFAQGSAVPNAHTLAILAKLTPILKTLPEAISLAGYTDAAAYTDPNKSNWDLSAQRANATRQLLTDSGLPDERIRDVTGHADRDLLHPETPLAAANRRVTITLLRSAGPMPNQGK
jgi:chemotaxis protein MotB